ncbi:GNAT family N-acetyltransferase [Chelativorans sp.]|uniref:GNAT family N-acetyltransferase n=1 Tax=Chelativorans sp. TaxID=2203393 RepID=UPI0028115FD5|nr:GNAT family N-acetyltransferase [Chelativorans sp.]
MTMDRPERLFRRDETASLKETIILEASEADYSALLNHNAPRNLTLPDTPIASLGVLQMLADVATSVRPIFSPASWLIVEAGEVVGLCSITRPPQAGTIDIGYGIAPSRHRRGIATRAIGHVVSWAHSRPEIAIVTAETGRANQASQSVLIRNGFVVIGERIDPEDGELICWQRPVG